MTPSGRVVSATIERMRAIPQNVSYSDMYRLCVQLFGAPRQSGGSHAVFATPWAGDPQVNIQDDHGKAKAYQVRQVLAAIDRLREDGA